MADLAPASPQIDPVQQRSALIASALRQKTPEAVLDPTCAWQPSEDQAATTALNNASDVSTKKEVGGVLYKNDDGQYCYSIPVGNSNSYHFKLAAHSAPGQQMAGVYHTHPKGNGEDSTFSEDDVNMANQLKMASYIKALKNDEIRRLDPASAQIAMHLTPSTSHGVLVPQPKTPPPAIAGTPNGTINPNAT